MQHRDRLTEIAWIVVRFGKVVNRVFLAAVIAGIASTWLFEDPLVWFLGQARPGVDVPAIVLGLRLEMLIGVAGAVATDRLLAALRDILATARTGDPFVADNSARLRAAAYALLVLQLLDIPAALLGRAIPALGTAAPTGDVSVGGWMAVLLLFVLAQVFAAGSVMRDDLAGTV